MMQLIRAVTADKPIILMDESFSAVDAKKYKAASGKTVVDG